MIDNLTIEIKNISKSRPSSLSNGSKKKLKINSNLIIYKKKQKFDENSTNEPSALLKITYLESNSSKQTL